MVTCLSPFTSEPSAEGHQRGREKGKERETKNLEGILSELIN